VAGHRPWERAGRHRGHRHRCQRQRHRRRLAGRLQWRASDHGSFRRHRPAGRPGLLPVQLRPGEHPVGNGTGAPFQAQVSGNEETLSGGTFTDLNGDNPLQLANAGDTSGQGHAIPDLIAINGDSVNGYYLEFDPDNGTPDLWTVGAGGTVTAYLATLGSGTAALAAQPTQVLAPSP
jgi:hypothetical protein